MAMLKVLSKKIADITECSICSESFKGPKVLPCIHTFCLVCLQTYGKDKNVGDKVACPICRDTFTIPVGGFNKLPNNFFIIHLLQVNSLSPTESTLQNGVCELCSEGIESAKASAYCIECGQHLCVSCCMIHKKQKFGKNHQIVSRESMPCAEQLTKMAPSYCEEHPTDEIKFYCYDCKMTSCVVCYVDKHNTHKCSDVKKSAEKFRGQLNDDVGKLEACALQHKEEISKLQSDKNTLINKVQSVKQEMSKQFEKLRALIDSHLMHLTKEFDSFRDKRLKEMETRKDDVERQFVIVESLKRYCTEVKDKGTAGDISRAAHDLRVRIKGLLKTQKEFNNGKISEVTVKFTPSTPVADIKINNWIGAMETTMTGATAGSEIKGNTSRATHFTKRCATTTEVLETETEVTPDVFSANEKLNYQSSRDGWKRSRLVTSTVEKSSNDDWERSRPVKSTVPKSTNDDWGKSTPVKSTVAKSSNDDWKKLSQVKSTVKKSSNDDWEKSRPVKRTVEKSSNNDWESDEETSSNDDSESDEETSSNDDSERSRPVKSTVPKSTNDDWGKSTPVKSTVAKSSNDDWKKLSQVKSTVKKSSNDDWEKSRPVKRTVEKSSNNDWESDEETSSNDDSESDEETSSNDDSERSRPVKSAGEKSSNNDWERSKPVKSAGRSQVYISDWKK